jgi:LDH2 family malate/lactate/ureidoglycolate dehydrogenase
MDIEASRLTEFSNRCLEKAGVPVHEAQMITSTMIEADARGINSHGLMRLPIYIQRIQKGLVRPLSHIVVERDHQATAVLDANGSAGQIAGTQAMDLAISKAKTYGIGAVSVKNSNHFGIAAHYALKASRNHMIGIVMSNTAPLMPPTGGAEKVLGNNPLSIAVPSNNEYPLLLDMALSNAALGKIIFAQTKGVPIPEGWGADRNGKPTTDPSDVLNGGFILPAAGPKGFGLAFMIELMTGVLGDTQFSRMIPSMYDLTQPQSISHFMLAINITHFMDMDRFTGLASVLSSYVKHAVKAEGVQELYLPGEIEFRSEEKKMKEGIPVSDNVLAELNTLALSLQVPELKQI